MEEWGRRVAISVLGSWCEGEKAFPLKKRRGSFERRSVSEVEASFVKERKTKPKMKTKLNKKHAKQEGHDKERKESADSGSNAKMRARGSALLEGSRCSHVNGRGWRCCQLTLVGYSLCEHRLGKGRLRSMTSVRSRSIGSSGAYKKDENMPLSSPSVQVHEQETEKVATDDIDRVAAIHKDINERKLQCLQRRR